MKDNIIALCFLLMGFCIPFYANAKVETLYEKGDSIVLLVTQSYTMGDNDTFIDAKKVNISEVKRAASDFAGSYVESSITVQNEQVSSQQIRILTAGFIKITDEKVERKLLDNGKVLVITKAKVELSKKSIKEGLAKLKSNPVKREKLIDLERQNRELRKKIYELSKLKGGLKGYEKSKQINEMLERVESNSNGIQKVIYSNNNFGGILDKNDHEVYLGKLFIDNALINMLERIKLKVEKVSFMTNTDGTYNAQVDIRWDDNRRGADIGSVFRYKYLDGQADEKGYSLGRRNMFKYEPEKRDVGMRLLDYFTKYRVDVHIKAFGMEQTIPILDVGEDNEYIALSLNSQRRHVIFENLPRNVIENSSEVELSIVKYKVD